MCRPQVTRGTRAVYNDESRGIEGNIESLNKVPGTGWRPKCGDRRQISG